MLGYSPISVQGRIRPCPGKFPLIPRFAKVSEEKSPLVEYFKLFVTCLGSPVHRRRVKDFKLGKLIILQNGKGYIKRRKIDAVLRLLP